ncbi:carbohydrate ABC transporter permease [Acuticoccus sp. MNP-M23]|uniref:carbohydrate ABC transporter permease n=1 Tax=Acuticoccus sp. MNP-M23 TaxID=3072793 RepID=UPI002815FB9F|nr:carbohydrate ABC transporter permease [Acuticoccus sp. MNP-M23]WMS41164.1 carbohydrate ABC transporter permease [Acuticoccus sp. MNP-M23]
MTALQRANVRPGRILVWTLLFLGGVLMVMPFFFMISTSLKTPDQVYDLRFIPARPTLANYEELLQDARFKDWFINSLITSTLVTASVLFFDSLVGYTLAKFKFRGRGLVFVAILSTLMIPTEMLVIPWYVMSAALGWTDTLWGIMFPGLITGFGVFLMRQFFGTVPDELIDAARIDGLSEFRIWWEIALPLVAPALSALAIFTFLGNWTAFLWPLIVTSDSHLFTVPVGLSSFASENLTRWEMVMTGAAVSTIPTLIVFIVFQKYIIRGVVLSGLKG